MHANHTAIADLVLERLPNGEHAYLRPPAIPQLDRYRLNHDRVVIVDPVPDKPKFIPRAECPQFVVQTQTVYLVSGAPTAARALQWFADKNDIDLDVETLDFGTVEVLGQVRADGEPEDDEPRYWITDSGRRALATAAALDKGPTVAEVMASRPARCPACGQGQDAPDCATREHWGVA
jgi:hypothetical protein